MFLRDVIHFILADNSMDTRDAERRKGESRSTFQTPHCVNSAETRALPSLRDLLASGTMGGARGQLARSSVGREWQDVPQDVPQSLRHPLGAQFDVYGWQKHAGSLAGPVVRRAAPLIYVSPLGMLAVYLFKDLVLEMTIDGAVRILNQIGGSSVAINANYDMCAVYHQCIRLTQKGDHIRLRLYGERRMEQETCGDVCLEAKHGESIRVGVSQQGQQQSSTATPGSIRWCAADGGKFTMAEGREWEGDDFDATPHLLYKARYGLELHQLAWDMAQRLTWYQVSEDLVFHARLFSFTLSQEQATGILSLYQECRAVALRLTPLNNTLSLASPGVACHVGEEGEVRVRARGSGLTLTATGNHCLLVDPVGGTQAGFIHLAPLYTS